MAVRLLKSSVLSFSGSLAPGSAAGKDAVPRFPLATPPRVPALTATSWQGAMSTLGWALGQMLPSLFLVRAGKYWGHAHCRITCAAKSSEVLTGPRVLG